MQEGIKNQPNCPKCGSMGRISEVIEGNVLFMDCPKCKRVWLSTSGICSECGRENIFPSNGLCIDCYAKKLSERGITSEVK